MANTDVYKNPEPSISLTAAQLKDMMIAFAQEIRRPTPEQEEETQKKKELLARTKADKLELVRIEMESKAQREASCAHLKQNGQSTIMGQKHSDGKIHPICLRCQKEFPPYRARTEEDVDI